MFLLTDRNVLHLLAMATCLHICQAKSFTVGTTDSSLWQPKEGTRSEWMACRGMPKDVCERIKIKKHSLHKSLAKKFGLGDSGNVSSMNDSDVGQCIMFTEEQLDMMIAKVRNAENKTSTYRTKRSLIDLKKYPLSKWSMPISYKFDGSHDEKQKATIRGAFQHWMDNTCVRFRELPTTASFASNHILMTSQGQGFVCWSYVGKITQIPQQINLAPACLEVYGTALHEIGHSLGLYHEQSRIDRNDSIKILWENIQTSAWSQYVEEPTDALGLPYNFGSVMHYPSKSGNSVNGLDTMIALEPLYQLNMGQRSDLSFHDRKIINLAYCKGTCTTPLSQSCQRGGYQNPNSCSTCICPDGFSGQYCDQIARPQNANCGGILNIMPGTQQVIKSPGYDDKGYTEKQECTWWIKAPKDYKMELTFSGIFSIYCRGSACYHWVEIKYKTDLGLDGARFCCPSRPNVTVISESNEMMVIFRSNFSVEQQWTNSLRGFQAIIKPIPPVGSSSSSTSTPASSSRTSTSVSTRKSSSTTTTSTTRTSSPTSSSTTSTSTKTPTTTKSATTTKSTTRTTTSVATTRATIPGGRSSSTTPYGNRKSLFRCSFETTSSGNSLCGMTQDKTDQFDWTVYHGPTPSNQTGPDFPYDGNSYIYIDARSPRKPNDEARLFFPMLNFTGEVCVNFFYHMYGQNIKTLKLVRINDSLQTVVWSRTGQIGNSWLQASVGVALSSCSQLQFVGIRGDGNSGDIGLDKIEVTSGSCAPYAYI